MKFIKRNLFHKDITVAAIQEFFHILMPDEEWSPIGMGVPNLSSMHGLFRRVPIKVRGSPTVRPYPHEVPALMHKIIDMYPNKHLQETHPIVATVLFMMNFLYVHPFHDSNGRVSRLLLQTMLYNHKFFGCVLPVLIRLNSSRTLHLTMK